MDYAVFVIRHHFLLEDRFLSTQIEDVKGHCAVLTRAVCLLGICMEASLLGMAGITSLFLMPKMDLSNGQLSE